MLTSEIPSVSPSGRYCMTEAAKKMGICRATLYKYVMSNDIHVGFRKSNSRRFILGSEILRFWNEQM